MSNFTIIDISPRIGPGIAVFPGDQNFERKVLMHWQRGDHLELSSLLSTVHLGAHADAPSHYHHAGRPIGERPLNYYLGTCQVVEVFTQGLERRIFPEHLGSTEIKAPRVLFKTNSFPDPNHWHDDFASLSPELIDHLAARQVKLVGIDTPSVDPASAKDLITHHKIFHHDLAILEGLVLTQVPAGLYTLIALPLRLDEAEASPVRAVLLQGVFL